jgi:hypothetical protein
MRAVIPCVDCVDFLRVTLPAWKAFLPKNSLVVATSPRDRETQIVAAACGVPVYITDAWTRVDWSCHVGGEPKFNKALGLDEAFGFAGPLPAPEPGELCLSLDVDGYPFGKFPKEKHFEANRLYGYYRHECLSPEALADHVQGREPLSAYRKMHNSGNRPVGYFQLFRYRPGVRFGSYPNAGKYDVKFIAHEFPQWQMRPESEVYLFHLGPQGDSPNWSGRTVPRWGES